jgi:hypothetical protein
MNLFEFTGLARSGHHAIINWVIKNYCGKELPMQGKFQEIEDRYLYYINEANFDQHLIRPYLEERRKRIQHLFVGYENAEPNFSLFSPDKNWQTPYDFCYDGLDYPIERQKIILIRDFYNNLASRVKKNLGGIFDNQGRSIQFDISNHFIQIWKQQAHEIINRKCAYLKFEDWINSPKIRQQFLFENFKIFEIWDHTQVKGTVSSFEELDKSKINDRVSQVEFTDQTKSLVNSDNELKELILELGYSIKQL